MRQTYSMSKAAAYEHKKLTERARQAAASAAGRDIGKIPPPANPARREEGYNSFRRFCEIYFAAVFCKPWSADHLKVIAKIEQAVITGGTFAMALPRGSGKSCLSEAAVLWAILTGRRRFVVLIAATGDMAAAMLQNIRTTIETNDLLAEDFPEACLPIRKLEGIVGRCAGQTCKGVSTRIVWKANRLVFPTIKGSVCSGSIITCTGLTAGGIRGQRFKRADGSVSRPDLAIVDDPQTSESGWSVSQCERRLRLLAGDVLGMAGPGQKISGVLCCTVIRPGDLSDSILDKSKNPQWQGERTKLIYKFPSNQKLWDQYEEMRAESFRNGGDGSNATEFYRQHPEKMDKGAEVAWPERYNDDDLSAIQHAMNLLFRDRTAFYSEYQNEPLAISTVATALLDEKNILAKMEKGRKRLTIPSEAEHVVSFLDIHQKMLYYGVGAFCPNFTGWLIDYGAFPDQRRNYWTLADGRFSLKQKYPGTGDDGCLLVGLRDFLDDLLGREYLRDDGSVLRIRRCLVDAGWKTSVVHQAIRQSKYAALVLPAKGVGITASNKPFSEYKRYPGDKVGEFWRIPSRHGRRELRTVHIDSNHYKSKLMASLATALGDPGSFALFQDKGGHKLLIDHLLGEYCIQTEGRGRKVDEWKQRPERPDQHLLDVLAGLFVAASMEGCQSVGVITRKTPRRTMARGTAASDGPNNFTLERPPQRIVSRNPGISFSYSW